MAVFVILLHSAILDGAVHPFDLTVGPWMVGLGQPVFDPVGFADHVATHLAECHAILISGPLGELDAIVRQDRMYFVRHSVEQMLKETPGCFSVGFIHQSCDRELAGSVNDHKEIECYAKTLYHLTL